MVLLLEDHPGRRKLKEYFYSERLWLTWLFWIGILFTFTGIGIFIGIPVLVVWAVFKVYFMVAGSKGDERLYDEILAQDVEYLKQRSVETLGVIEDEYSLADAIAEMLKGENFISTIITDGIVAFIEETYVILRLPSQFTLLFILLDKSINPPVLLI